MMVGMGKDKNQRLTGKRLHKSQKVLEINTDQAFASQI